MANDRYAEVSEAANGRRHVLATFNFDRFHVTFLDQTQRVAHRILDADVMRAERHVSDQKRRLCTSCNRSTVIKHLIQTELGGGLVTTAYHGKRVADKANVNIASLFDVRRRPIIMCRQCSELFIRFVLLFEIE